MYSVATTCPYCFANNVAVYGSTAINLINPGYPGPRPKRTTHDGYGTCSRCHGKMVLHFRFDGPNGKNPHEINPPSDANYFRYDREQTVRFLGTSPRLPALQIPEHLPQNVENSLLEAERALEAELFTSAAASYRKAVDRAVSPFAGGEGKGKTLGRKLGLITKAETLPPSMLEWIEAVVKDGNFALHDEELDFTTAEEVAPIRDFATALLTYLYTMPERVRQMRERDEA